MVVETIFEFSCVISRKVASCYIVSGMATSTTSWKWWQWCQSCTLGVQLGSTDVAGSGDVARSHGGSDAAMDAECSRRPTEKGVRVAPNTSRIIALCRSIAHALFHDVSQVGHGAQEGKSTVGFSAKIVATGL